MDASNSTEDEIELWLRVVHGIVGSLLLLSDIFGSCAVLLLVICNRKLRYPSTVISLGLIVADLVIAFIWLIQVLLLSGVGEWTLGDDTCTALGVLLIWMLYVRWSEIAVVTMDRFLIVVFPFFTYKRCSKPLMVVMTILAWFVPAVLVLPSFHGLGRYTFRLQISSCTVDCEGDTPCTIFYTGLFGLYLLIGGALPAALYTTMYCIGLVKRWKYKNRKLGTVGSDSVASPQEPSSSTSTSADANTAEAAKKTGNTRQPASNDDLGDHSKTSSTRRRSTKFRFLKARERRALMTVFIIFISMVITHIPTYFLSAVRSVGNIYESTPLIVHYISVYIFLIGLILDSVIIMRNKDFRDVITKLFKRRTVRPTSFYNAGRRPSVMLLLSGNNGSKQNGGPITSERRSSTGVVEGRTRQNGMMDIIFEEDSNSHTLNVDRRASIEESCYKYVTDV